MRTLIVLFILTCNLTGVAQKSNEYYVLNTEINEFDVLGTDEYETNLNDEENINHKLLVKVGADATSPDIDGISFNAKNTLDANMKTAWLTPDAGKGAQIEYVFDLTEAQLKSGTIFKLAVFNGWRKDYQTWNDYGRVKTAFITVNDVPYAEVTLEDTYKLQYIDFDRQKIDTSHRYRIRLKIMDTYPGKKSTQTALSDFQIIGRVK